jgi:tryptophan 2,3-dioxygenase
MSAQRPLEDGIVKDFKVNLSYGAYLRLDDVLGAQHPVSVPEHHDELLFIVQHQTSELWLKLIIHELRAVQEYLAKDELRPALKGLARVKHIQRTLTEQWSVLATLTPSEYAEFRSFLGTSSGFQSFQYRAIEFRLGNKNRDMLRIFDDQPGARALLEDALLAPSVYDEFLHFLARRGHQVPAEILQRDVTDPYEYHAGLVPVFREIYENAEQNWDVYEAWTWRRTSSCGASGTSRQWNGRSASSGAAAGPAGWAS